MTIAPTNPVTHTGTYAGPHGSGTFSRTNSGGHGVRTSDTTFTATDGTQRTRDVVTTRTAAGFTRVITTTAADGTVRTTNETATRTATGYELAGSTTQGQHTQTLAGSLTRSADGAAVTESLTFTGPHGHGRSVTVESTGHGTNTVNYDAHGTRANASTFDAQTALTLLT